MNLSLEEIEGQLRKAGATQLVAKPLSENDNSKQQVYLGMGFDAITLLPFGVVVAEDTAKRPNFKAKVDLRWLTEGGIFEPARHAQLILYPDYPEVRLSGFLRGCRAAPSNEMRPIPKHARGERGVWDGRVLFLGTTEDGKILAVLGSKGSRAADDFLRRHRSIRIEQTGVLFSWPLSTKVVSEIDVRETVLDALRAVKNLGWTNSVRMYADGTLRPYKALNGGGYTLEALLGIKPNGRSEPDFLGWELKAYSSDRVTLMTPEPDGGFYGESGAEAFLRKYGRSREDGAIYFTGTHRIGSRHAATQQTLTLAGYDAARQRITDVKAGITLTDRDGNAAAVWTYGDLISHWGRKHANTAYIKYRRQGTADVQYEFLSPAMLGQGTDFGKFLQAMHVGKVFYDPAPKLTGVGTGSTKVKARSQFRVLVRDLALLYDEFGPHPL
jgi:hypothetical protein